MSAEPFPANVSRLTEIGVPFTHRAADHDIKLECPICGNVLWLHEEKPFHYCPWPTCAAWMKSFDDLLKALTAGKVAK